MTKTTIDKNTIDFEQPLSMVDTVIFTVLDQALHVLLVKRSLEPFKYQWSLVGGFIDTAQDKSLEDTAKRKLFEKTSVQTPYLEQLECVGSISRDPRGWSVTHVYFALIPHEEVNLQHGNGASDIQWVKVEDESVKHTLAFDHTYILQRAIQRLRNKVLYTSLPVFLMPQQFTLKTLQNAYEAILGKKIEHKSFRRRMLNADLLIETDAYSHERGRPAKIYQAKPGARTYFFTRILEGVR